MSKGGGATMIADILSSLESAARPLAKGLIKTGIYLYDTVLEVTVEAGEQCKDLVAEAKAELAKQDGETPEEEATGWKAADKDHNQHRGKRKTRVRVRQPKSK